MDTEHEFKEELVVNGKTYHVEGRVRKWNPVKGYEDDCPKGLVCEARCVETNTVAWSSSKRHTLLRLSFAVKLTNWLRSDAGKPYREDRDLLWKLFAEDPLYLYAGVTAEELEAKNAKDGGHTYGAFNRG